MGLLKRLKTRIARVIKGPDAEFSFVVSFPKSGRTWLRVMLHHLEIPVKFTHDDSRHLDAIPLSELETGKSRYAGKKVLLLIRDPRDTVVSGYYQASKRISPPYPGSMSAFVRDPKHGIEKIVLFNLNWFANASVPRSIYLLEYERLRADTVGEMTRVAAFLGMSPLDTTRIAAAVEAARFDKMKELESRGVGETEVGVALVPRDPGDPDSFKVRKGKVGSYAEELSDSDITFCNEVLRKYRYAESLERARQLIQSRMDRA